MGCLYVGWEVVGRKEERACGVGGQIKIQFAGGPEIYVCLRHKNLTGEWPRPPPACQVNFFGVPSSKTNRCKPIRELAQLHGGAALALAPLP